VPEICVAERLAAPETEVRGTIGEAQFLEEVERCFSCGLCFGCEQCFMYCNGGGFLRLDEPAPGSYFALKLDGCEGCRKCVELCPCGFLSAQPLAQATG
jgi:Pyruvate/2-oxoacid:ferredoxin oxidoreductase delta subunit